MRCVECGAESAGATEVCVRCGAPVVLRLSVAADAAADAAGQVASAAIPASIGQQLSEPAEYSEKLTELDPATTATPSCTELAARARRELNAHPAEPLCCIDTGGSSDLSVSWHPNGRSIAVATSSPLAADGSVLIEVAQHPAGPLTEIPHERISRKCQSAFVPCPCQNGRKTAVARGHSRTPRTASDLGTGRLTRRVKRPAPAPP
jgi:hypothetical protein